MGDGKGVRVGMGIEEVYGCFLGDFYINFCFVVIYLLILLDLVEKELVLSYFELLDVDESDF